MFSIGKFLKIGSTKKLEKLPSDLTKLTSKNVGPVLNPETGNLERLLKDGNKAVMSANGDLKIFDETGQLIKKIEYGNRTGMESEGASIRKKTEITRKVLPNNQTAELKVATTIINNKVYGKANFFEVKDSNGKLIRNANDSRCEGGTYRKITYYNEKGCPRTKKEVEVDFPKIWDMDGEKYHVGEGKKTVQIYNYDDSGKLKVHSCHIKYENPDKGDFSMTRVNKDGSATTIAKRVDRFPGSTSDRYCVIKSSYDKYGKYDKNKDFKIEFVVHNKKSDYESHNTIELRDMHDMGLLNSRHEVERTPENEALLLNIDHDVHNPKNHTWQHLVDYFKQMFALYGTYLTK